MKKLLFALALTALFVSTTAFAQLNWEDNIGLYMDEAATTSCGVAPAGFIPAFLTLTHVTSSSVAGWEVKITGAGGGMIFSVSPRGQFINAASIPGEYSIGLGTPLIPVNGTLVLADVQVLISDDATPTYGFLGPVYYDSLGNGLPAYVDGVDRNLVKRLVPALGGVDQPQLIANGDCSGVVADEDASFGNVKALFR